MNKSLSRFGQSLIVLFILSLATLQSSAVDYRSIQGAIHGTFAENRIAKTAASIGRASGALSQKDIKKIANAIDSRAAIPAELSNTWQKLVRSAQSIIYLESKENFYSVGYEFETVHLNKISYDEWDKGAKWYKNLIAGSFGIGTSAVFNPEGEDLYPRAKYTDEAGGKWILTTESVRYTEAKSGYELGSPPVLRATGLEDMAAFRWRLGTHKVGQSNKMTGAHQTYFPFPVGEEKISPDLAARVAANLQLLQAQYGPAIHEMVDVRRWGGAVGNMYFRPVVFDHYPLLKDLSNLNPKTASLEEIHSLLFNKYIKKEVEVQARAQMKVENIDQAGFDKLLASPLEEQQKYRMAWKYRDTQLKINLSGTGPVLLWESRIGDYVANEPERAMVKTLIDQLLIDRAYSLAKEGKIFQLDIPERALGESEADYWSRLQMDPRTTPTAFLEEVKLPEPEIKKMLLGRSFVARNPAFKAGSKISFAYDLEGWSDQLADIVLPRDPELRAGWRELSRKKRLKIMSELGVDLQAAYTPDAYRLLVTEFAFDHQKFPFGSPELHLEASGNWEIKASGWGLNTFDDLKTAVLKLRRKLSAEGFGLHLHAFLPDSELNKIKGKGAKAYSKFLGLQSLAMQLQGYAEASIDESPHNIDSWSLDRYSPNDVNRVKGHLEGTDLVKGVEQKYHNIAFRPVVGGIDIEPRDLGDDVNYGLRQIEMQLDYIKTPPTEGIADDKAVFMEFRDHESLRDVEEYTLEGALSKKYRLTSEERKLLNAFQFEVYKPSMQSFMYFEDFSAIEETPDELLDSKYVRTNFENNIAIPLLNYEDQSILKADQKKALALAKEEFLDRIYAKVKAVRANKSYAFLLQTDNTLHLCDYLQRSKHASRPDFTKVSAQEATKQRAALEKLTRELRGEVIRYVKKTKINDMVWGGIRSKTCPLNTLQRAG